MTYRKRLDRKGQLLEGIHTEPTCRWWPTESYREYDTKPWGDMCNQCRHIAKRRNA